MVAEFKTALRRRLECLGLSEHGQNATIVRQAMLQY
jgi:hypothetical protein